MDERLRSDAFRKVRLNFVDNPIADAGQCARKAVLWPVAKALGLQSYKVKGAAVRTLKAWQKLVDNLSEEGYHRLQALPAQMQWKNCWPSMVICTTRPTTCVCNRDAVCPWCYGRRVERLALACGLEDEELFQFRFRNTQTFVGESVRQMPYNSVEELGTFLKQAAAECKGFHRLFPRGSLLAGFWHVDAEPIDYPTGTAVRIHARLFTVRDRSVPCPTRLHCWDAWDHAYHTRMEIRQALAYCLSYPTGLLTGDPHTTAQILQARERQRLFEVSGGFRRFREPEPEEATDRPMDL